MKRLAWVCLVLTILVGLDGVYMTATHYDPKTVNQFHLSDGGTVLVSAFILLVVTIIAFIAEKNQTQSTINNNLNKKVKEG